MISQIKVNHELKKLAKQLNIKMEAITGSPVKEDYLEACKKENSQIKIATEIKKWALKCAKLLKRKIEKSGANDNINEAKKIIKQIYQLDIDFKPKCVFIPYNVINESFNIEANSIFDRVLNEKSNEILERNEEKTHEISFDTNISALSKSCENILYSEIEEKMKK